jgi:RNA polymerase sigma-70 factor (ECF subfamily)
MSAEESGSDLVRRWRSGDEQAAAELHRRYAQRLWALAEAQIGSRLGRRVDPDDVVQSAFRTFFRRSAAGEFAIDHSGALWRLLVRITLNKIARQRERHYAAKRDVRSEVSPDAGQLSPEAVAHDPTPEEAAVLTEALECVVAHLKPPDPEIVGLRLQGYSTSQIGREVGCSRWTVRNVLDVVGQRLERWLAGDSES